MDRSFPNLARRSCQTNLRWTRRSRRFADWNRVDFSCRGARNRGGRRPAATVGEQDMRRKRLRNRNLPRTRRGAAQSGPVLSRTPVRYPVRKTFGGGGGQRKSALFGLV